MFKSLLIGVVNTDCPSVVVKIVSDELTHNLLPSFVDCDIFNPDIDKEGKFGLSPTFKRGIELNNKVSFVPVILHNEPFSNDIVDTLFNS